MDLLRRLAPLLLLSLACLVVREQFPFSHFPMYSSFGHRTTYVFLADGEGAPLATREVAPVSTPTLKKIYENEVRRETERLGVRRSRLPLDARAAAGRRTLEYLHRLPSFRPPATGGGEVQLREVTISLRGHRLEKTTETVARR